MCKEYLAVPFVLSELMIETDVHAAPDRLSSGLKCEVA
jgi:hypothetical protein